MPSLPTDELDFKNALIEEARLLSEVDIPIITVSCTFREDLSDKYCESFPDTPEVVFSRAHYSMAMGLMFQASEMGYSAYMTDPTNFVVKEDWIKVVFTEFVGKIMARHHLLKELKDKIDTKARNKLPITKAIQEPLEYLFSDIHRPVLSLHYEAGRILSEAGKKVVQVITDPHVRPQYLDLLPTNKSTIQNLRSNYPKFCVFDSETKTEFLNLAKELNKQVNNDQIIVTGPPIDPRVIACREEKFQLNPLSLNHPLRLGITTSGLGTNKPEIQNLLNHLDPTLINGSRPILQLFLYAGTHADFHRMYQEFAVLNNIKIGELWDESAPVRILYKDNLIEANELLVKHMFPWADGVITKPSGDMAYDAAAAGCFQLFLEPWGEWEINVQDRFLKLNTAKILTPSTFNQLLDEFSQKRWSENSWFATARQNLENLPPLYLQGSRNIINATLEHK